MPKKQTQYQAKYDAAHTERVQLKLHKEKDADILARLAAQPAETGGKQGYIKRLIREDIKHDAQAVDKKG